MLADSSDQYEMIPQHQTPISVSALNKAAKQMIEQCFPSVYVTGEISNCMQPRSGHYYFSLKDGDAQISCALFKSYQGCLDKPLIDGMQVNIKGKLSIYPERGNYQLIATAVELAGDGQLKLAFEQLKKRLQAEGLFALEKKQALPSMPRTIGVVTSATGAAIQDIIKVLKERYRAATIIIYPTLVQGTEAAKQIVYAIEQATRRNECDVLIVGRGGGSYEDLWCFNEEIVARAIAACPLPTITGIGHEVDVTIADFVADVRAATPSQAAQLATPDQSTLRETIKQYAQALQYAADRCIRMRKLQLTAESKRLQHPLEKIHTWSQMLDHTETQLHYRWKQAIQSKQHQLKTLMATIEALSPMQTLQRGFSISSTQDNILHSVTTVKVGQTVDIQLADGVLHSIVDRITQLTEHNDE